MNVARISYSSCNSVRFCHSIMRLQVSPWQLFANQRLWAFTFCRTVGGWRCFCEQSWPLAASWYKVWDSSLELYFPVSCHNVLFCMKYNPGLGFLATVIGVFCYSGLVRGFFATVLTWGGFFATVPRGFFATVPACRGFFATVPACRGFFASVPRRFFASVFTSRQGNFKTTKITAGKLRFFGISSYS